MAEIRLFVSCGLFLLGITGEARAGTEPPLATYEMRVLGMAPQRFAVRAERPGVTETLKMADSWPRDVPELDKAACQLWSRISNVNTIRGCAVSTTLARPAGWTLGRFSASSWK